MSRIKADQLLKSIAANIESSKAAPKERTQADAVLGIELGQEFAEIPLELIDPSPNQIRFEIGLAEIEKLAEDIRENGLNQPISVRPVDGGRYQLVAGETRLRAFKSLGYPKIQAVVRHISDAQAAKASISENLLRSGVSDFEIATALKRAQELKIESSVAGLSRMIGKERQEVYRYLAYFNLPTDVLETIRVNHRSVNRSAAYELAAFRKETGDELADPLIIDVVEQIILGGVPNSRAAEWCKVELNKRGKGVAKGARTENRLVLKNNKGQRIGSYRYSGSRFAISLKDTDLAEKLDEHIKAFFSSLNPS